MADLSAHLTTGKKITSPADDPVQWSLASRSHEHFRSLDAVNNSLNEMATSINFANATMDAIYDLISQMKGIMESFVEHSPPFPSGEKKQLDTIANYNDIRKQISELTLPVENYGAKKLMADPQVFSDAGPLQIGTDDTGYRKTIRQQEVHPGVTGLDIPELSVTADINTMRNAITKLDTAIETLEARQSGLAADFTGIEPHKKINTASANMNRIKAEILETADLNEVAIELKALEVKSSIIYESVNIATNTQAQLTTLLK